jgi:hypothetical protein
MPSLYVIAGPNDAWKTTSIKRFAPSEFALLDFFNATQLRMLSRPMKRQWFETGLSGFLGFTGFCWVW